MRGVKAKELRALAEIAATRDSDKTDVPARRLTLIRHKPRYVRVPAAQSLAQQLWNSIKGIAAPTKTYKVEPIQYVQMEGTVRWVYHFLKRQYLRRRRA